LRFYPAYENPLRPIHNVYQNVLAKLFWLSQESIPELATVLEIALPCETYATCRGALGIVEVAELMGFN
jgi:hypothetical protein